MAKQESASSEERNSVYSVTIKEAAIRALKKIPKSFALKLDQKIQALSIQPRPSGCTKLEGYQNAYRIRHSDYRVVYTATSRKY